MKIVFQASIRVSGSGVKLAIWCQGRVLNQGYSFKLGF